MNSQLSIKNFILLLSGSLAFLNIMIFILRESFPKIWWIGDQQFYINTDFLLHLKSLLFFLLYLSILTILSIIIFKNNSTKFVLRKNLNGFFIFITIIFIIYIYVSYYYGIGVASSVENTAGSWQILFYFISFDGLFYAYALIEKNNKRLVFVSILYSISNIFRGWAGFVINLLIIYYIRNKPKINIRKIILLFIILLPIVGLLLFAREIFRGGTGLIELYDLKNYSGIEFYIQLLNHLLAKILIRFDFYSHYIGIESLNTSENMCYPYMENLYYKILLRSDLVNECRSLGSILPSHLSDWFIDKNTAFTVSSGFFALPLDQSIIYFYSNIFIYLLTTLLVRVLFNKYEIILFLVPLIFLLFLQGWIYQYIYIYLGFITGLFLIYISIGFHKDINKKQGRGKLNVWNLRNK